MIISVSWIWSFGVVAYNLTTEGNWMKSTWVLSSLFLQPPVNLQLIQNKELNKNVP